MVMSVLSMRYGIRSDLAPQGPALLTAALIKRVAA
jgi:hypothetical protein